MEHFAQEEDKVTISSAIKVLTLDLLGTLARALLKRMIVSTREKRDAA